MTYMLNTFTLFIICSLLMYWYRILVQQSKVMFRLNISNRLIMVVLLLHICIMEEAHQVQTEIHQWQPQNHQALTCHLYLHLHHLSFSQHSFSQMKCVTQQSRKQFILCLLSTHWTTLCMLLLVVK